MKSIVKKSIFGITITFVILLGLVVYIFYSGFLSLDSPCGNTIVGVTPSPSNKFKAVIFERDCGATTGFSTQISIIPYWNTLPDDEKGNIYRAEGDPREMGIKISWEDDHTLWVHTKLKGNEFATWQYSYHNQIIKVRFSEIAANKALNSQPSAAGTPQGGAH